MRVRQAQKGTSYRYIYGSLLTDATGLALAIPLCQIEYNILIPFTGLHGTVP